ncbi:MAG: energy-coupling factor transporter ATPase [Bacillota bacterium]|nr:energy-coupling factor transporter ATPase [Bacillota bacterium]
MSKIKTESLTYIYGEKTPYEKKAVQDVSIEIEEGEFIGLIGHTGSGKSTLVQHLNGLVKPTSGKIYIDGKDMWSKETDIRAVRNKVGLVFQYPEYQLFEETVYKDIAFGPTNMGLSEEEVRKNVEEAASIVGLRKELLEKSPFELSGGQKRRVAIAGVMAMKPQVLVLDEPTAGLDPRGRDEILARIKDYYKTMRTTVVLVSHSMEDIAKNATKVLVMNHSRVFMFAEVSEVFAHADEISKIGLEVPQITKVFMGLKKNGIDVNTSIYTVSQAVSEIKRYMAGGRKNA